MKNSFARVPVSVRVFCEGRCAGSHDQLVGFGEVGLLGCAGVLSLWLLLSHDCMRWRASEICLCGLVCSWWSWGAEWTMVFMLWVSKKIAFPVADF
uniref:Uncharacterized protein n=1 Tax=Physcomitrium patens TaxID=3218 RepID=A0A7I3ZEZ3_PHYPA